MGRLLLFLVLTLAGRGFVVEGSQPTEANGMTAGGSDISKADVNTVIGVRPITVVAESSKLEGADSFQDALEVGETSKKIELEQKNISESNASLENRLNTSGIEAEIDNTPAGTGFNNDITPSRLEAANNNPARTEMNNDDTAAKTGVNNNSPLKSEAEINQTPLGTGVENDTISEQSEGGNGNTPERMETEENASVKTEVENMINENNPTKTAIEENNIPIRFSLEPTNAPTRAEVEIKNTPAQTALADNYVPVSHFIETTKTPAQTAVEQNYAPVRLSIETNKTPTQTVLENINTPVKLSTETNNPARHELKKNDAPEKISVEMSNNPLRLSVVATNLPTRTTVEKNSSPGISSLEITNTPERLIVESTKAPARTGEDFIISPGRVSTELPLETTNAPTTSTSAAYLASSSLSPASKITPRDEVTTVSSHTVPAEELSTTPSVYRVPTAQTWQDSRSSIGVSSTVRARPTPVGEWAMSSTVKPVLVPDAYSAVGGQGIESSYQSDKVVATKSPSTTGNFVRKPVRGPATRRPATLRPLRVTAAQRPDSRIDRVTPSTQRTAAVYTKAPPTSVANSQQNKVPDLQKKGGIKIKKPKKKDNGMSSLLYIPLMIQAQLIPMMLMNLKFLALKALTIGKLALLILGLNLLRNAMLGYNSMEEQYESESLASQHYGYTGSPEYGSWVNRRMSGNEDLRPTAVTKFSRRGMALSSRRNRPNSAFVTRSGHYPYRAYASRAESQ